MDIFEDFKKQRKHKTYFSFLLSELDDDEISNAVKLLNRLSSEGVNLFALYKDAKEAKVDPDYTISTVFTSKGLEFETVNIADDLNGKFKLACNGEIPENDAVVIMKCYYVAASRCGVKLYNALL